MHSGNSAQPLISNKGLFYDEFFCQLQYYMQYSKRSFAHRSYFEYWFFEMKKKKKIK